MFIIIHVKKVEVVLDIFEYWTRVIFGGASKFLKFRVEIANKHDIVGKIVNGLEK